VLCTDKTGNAHRGPRRSHAALQRRWGVKLMMFLDGYLISYFQTGLKNLLDRAIFWTAPDFHGKEILEKYKKLDEDPI